MKHSLFDSESRGETIGIAFYLLVMLVIFVAATYGVMTN